MPPQEASPLAVTSQADFPRPLNHVEKNFVKSDARVAAGITFAQPRSKADVIAALEGALLAHPIGSAHLDASHRRLDWHRSTGAGSPPPPQQQQQQQQTDLSGGVERPRQLLLGRSDFAVEEADLPRGDGLSATGGFGATGLPLSFIERKTGSGSVDITLLRAPANGLASAPASSSFGGVVLNASRALIDFASFRVLVEKFVHRLDTISSHAATNNTGGSLGGTATSTASTGLGDTQRSSSNGVYEESAAAPGFLNRAGVIKLLGPGATLPASFLDLDPKLHPVSDTDKAVKAAAKFSDKSAHLEEKEGSERAHIWKSEESALHDLFKTEHGEYEKVKKLEEKQLKEYAARIGAFGSELDGITARFSALVADETKGRRVILDERTADLRRASAEVHEEAKRHKAEEKRLIAQADMAKKEGKTLHKEEKKLDKLAHKREKVIQKETSKHGVAATDPSMVTAKKTEAAYRQLGGDLHKHEDDLKADEVQLRQLALVEHDAAQLLERQCHGLETFGHDWPRELKEYDDAKQAEANGVVAAMRQNSASVKERETEVLQRAQAAHQDGKSHSSDHKARVKAILEEIAAAMGGTRGGGNVGDTTLHILELREIFGSKRLPERDDTSTAAVHNNTAGSDFNSSGERFFTLPRSVVNSIVRNANGGSSIRLSAFLAAGFAIAAVSEAHARGYLDGPLRRGIFRLGVPIHIAVDLREDVRTRAAPGVNEQSLNFPMQCTGFVTIAVAFEDRDLRRAVGYPSSIDFNFDDKAAAAAKDGEQQQPQQPQHPQLNRSIADNFDLGALADRVESDIRRRIARGEAHREAIGFIEGDTGLLPPAACFGITNVGMLRDAPGFDIQLGHAHELEGAGVLQAGGLHALAWGSTNEGDLRLALDDSSSSSSKAKFGLLEAGGFAETVRSVLSKSATF